MSEPTVTGKAAWDALGEGKALSDGVNSVDFYQLRLGWLVRVRRDGWWELVQKTPLAMCRRTWLVHDRIDGFCGDEPPWSEG